MRRSRPRPRRVNRSPSGPVGVETTVGAEVPCAPQRGDRRDDARPREPSRRLRADRRQARPIRPAAMRDSCHGSLCCRATARDARTLERRPCRGRRDDERASARENDLGVGAEVDEEHRLGRVRRDHRRPRRPSASPPTKPAIGGSTRADAPGASTLAHRRVRRKLAAIRGRRERVPWPAASTSAPSSSAVIAVFAGHDQALDPRGLDSTQRPLQPRAPTRSTPRPPDAARQPNRRAPR